MLRAGEPNFFLDRCFLSELPSEVATAVASKGLTLQGDSERVSFVGVILNNDSVNIFLPRSSILPSGKAQTYQVASNVMLAIEKYGRSSAKTLINQVDEGSGYKNLAQLTLLKELLTDFIQNGIYSKRKQIRRINQGKVDWKKTVNGFNPYPSRDGQPVYIDTYGVNREDFSNCEVAKIHAKVISIIDQRISWLLLGDRRLDTLALREYQKPTGEVGYQILQLRREIATTYSDRDIRLLRMLIDFLERLAGLNESPLVIGLTKFHFCWEAMLAKVLEFVEPVNSKLPFPVYVDSAGCELPANPSSMITDIFMHDHARRVIAVVDAKYYAATKASDSPRWKDIVKQLFYDQAIETLSLNASIKNIFVFPGNEGNMKKVAVRRRDVDKQGTVSFVDKFKPIYCYYVDPLAVIESYTKNKKMAEFSVTLLQSEPK